MALSGFCPCCSCGLWFSLLWFLSELPIIYNAVDLIQRWPQVRCNAHDAYNTENLHTHTHRSRFCQEVLILEIQYDKECVWWTLQEGCYMGARYLPCNGFYANILGYLKSHYPSLGTLLSKIDPHLAAIVNTSRHWISLRKTWIHWWPIHQKMHQHAHTDKYTKMKCCSYI